MGKSALVLVVIFAAIVLAVAAVRRDAAVSLAQEIACEVLAYCSVGVIVTAFAMAVAGQIGA